MAEMTDKEAEYWDEYYTQNPPKTDPAKPGIFAQNVDHMVILDDLSINYLRSRAEAARKTPSQIISELIRGEIARNAEPAMAGK
ncbi:MAG: hypothetical protein LBI86_01600 [Treponema sp.]|jgi:hypothetical protein|nr:hypothetical protein [Treponema sp.]